LQPFLTQEQEEQREQGEQGELEELVNGCKKNKFKKSFSQHKALQELSHEAYDIAVILSILEHNMSFSVVYGAVLLCQSLAVN
jgi:hypothetical protein